MNTEITIFVEGKGDEKFIFSYIKHLFGSSKAEKIKKNIINAGGWEKIKLLKPKFMETTDAGGNNLVIFDADNIKNNGGFNKRKEEIEKIKTDLEINFDLFLFPNNNDDGDYETLLENIINPQNSHILDCFTKYENCLSEHKDNNGNPYKFPLRKAKIYSYIDAFNLTRKENEEFKKGNMFFENTNYWDLNCTYLNNLKIFLEKYIN